VHIVQAVLLPMLERLGPRVSLTLVRTGWYPKGGGEIRVGVTPAWPLRGQRWVARGALRQICGWSLVTNLPRSIADRQRAAAMAILRTRGHAAEIECLEAPGVGRGTCLTLVAESEGVLGAGSSLGRFGKPAERVGEKTARQLLSYLDAPAALDEHLADQIPVFLAMAQGPSEFTTARVTPHLLTNLWVIRQCVPVRVSVDGAEGAPGRVRLDWRT
jgi:RNA 3'-terminal phosphate cyclase (ATP)